jgi:hypothetical protein
MGQTRCSACGRAIEAEEAVEHHLVPEEVEKLFGISDSAVAVLCKSCSREVSDWYQKMISSVTYDSNLKRFREKSPVEMASEYHKAYGSFMDFRQKRRKKNGKRGPGVNAPINLPY